MTKLMQEHLLRGKLERAPLAKPKSQVDSLPEVPAPDVSDLVVEVPTPAPITEAMLQNAVAEMALAHGEFIEREGDAPVEPGDEVLVDLVAYANGRVVPGSAKPEVWLTSDDEPALPGLRAVLNGHTIGKSVWAKVNYGEDAPVPFLVDQQLVYAVDILAARAITPAPLDSPSLLEAAGVEDVDGLVGLVNEGLEAERNRMASMHVQLAVADALQARLGDVEIADEIIDAELAHRWNEIEGEMLREKGLSVEDQTFARDAFVKAPGHRAELVHGLRTTMALAAIAKAHDIAPAREDLDRWLGQVAAFEGRPVEEVFEAFKEDADAHEAVGQALLLEKNVRVGARKGPSELGRGAGRLMVSPVIRPRQPTKEAEPWRRRDERRPGSLGS